MHECVVKSILCDSRGWIIGEMSRAVGCKSAAPRLENGESTCASTKYCSSTRICTSREAP